MHISLDSALGRQRRLNSVGESVLQIAPNAAAAYSLRSLTGGDPKVVRVRRKSDNAERDFTASGVTSGALTSFVNEDVTIYQSDFSAGVNGFVQTSTTTATGNQDGVSDSAGTSKDNVLKVVKAADSQGYMQRDQGVVAGLTYTVSGSFFAPASNTAVDGIMIKDGLAGSSLSNYPSGYLVSDGTWKDFSFSYTAASDGNQRVQLGISSLGSNPNGSSTGSSGDIVYIADLKFVETISNGFVETWYDQSGNSKDATQATASLQPKIVNAGSLLTDGIDFDGTDQVGLVTGSFSLTQAFTTFSVSHTDDASTSLGIWSTAASATDNFNTASFFRNDDGFAVNAGATLTTAGTIDYVADRTYLQTNVVNGGSSSIFVDGATGETGNAGSTNPSGVLIIGYFKSGGYLNLDGAIKELIIYDSDQTSNREALETNIAAANGVTLS